MKGNRFVVREEHIKLLRKVWVQWQDCEFGAPEIDPKRPYGNSGVYGDIAEILEIKPAKCCDHEQEFSHEQEEFMAEMHRGTEQALQILCRLGSLETGEYVNEDGYGESWKRA